MNRLRTQLELTYLAASITLVCFAGCSVTPPEMRIGLSLYRPPGAQVETTASYQLVRWRMGDQQLSLSPRGGVDDMLDLWLSIENQGDNPIQFSPSQIQYAYCNVPQAQEQRGSPSDGAACAPFTPVPSQAEAAAHLVARERKRKEADSADQAAVAAVLIVFVFALIVVAVAASSSGSSKGSWGHSYSATQPEAASFPVRAFVNAAVDVSYSDSPAPAPASVSREAFYGGNLTYAIAPAVVEPGGRHAGHIFIPPHANASLLRLQIQIGKDSTVVEFAYRTSTRSASAGS